MSVWVNDTQCYPQPTHLSVVALAVDSYARDRVGLVQHGRGDGGWVAGIVARHADGIASRQRQTVQAKDGLDDGMDIGRDLVVAGADDNGGALVGVDYTAPLCVEEAAGLSQVALDIDRVAIDVVSLDACREGEQKGVGSGGGEQGWLRDGDDGYDAKAMADGGHKTGCEKKRTKNGKYSPEKARQG